MGLTEKARQIFADDRFATELTGIDITAVGEHNATCTLRLGPQHRNARGVVMGGVLFTLADFAAAIAANSACIESGDFGPVNEWNREHIWQHGGRFTPAGLLSRVLEAEFDPGYYIDYLENKYTELYGL